MPELLAPLQAQVDPTNCDLEAIHHIESIQSIGFLVALAPDWIVARISENAAAFLGRPAGAILGILLDEVIHPDAIHMIRNRLSALHGTDAVERAFAVRLQDGGGLFDLAIHLSGQTIIIEAEPSVPSGTLNAGAMVRSMLDRMQGQANLAREATRLVQALTGFDRVMIYRFHPDGSGEVIAERVRSGLEPYLGLRYPAEDIPRQARALLIRNPVRLLADVNAATSPILSRPAKPDVPLDLSSLDLSPLDLSMSTLRAHSGMHIQYLVNMGVGSTMTVSLIRDGTLWGLISCHHMTPRHVGFEQRTTAELFAQMLSFLIEKRERDDLAIYEAHTRKIHDQLVAAVVERGSAGESVFELANRMSDLVPSDGIGLCVNGNVTLRGTAPTHEEFAGLRQFLDRTTAGQVYASEALAQVYAPARHFTERASGILVIPLSRSARDYLVFFRQEVACAVTWAGRPGKIAETSEEGARQDSVQLTPRRSFAAWREVMHGHSMPWSVAEQRAAEAMRITLFDVVLHLTGMTEQERRIVTQKQELLIAELNHRVRNILGLILGLVAQSRNSAVDMDTFATVLGDRVHALARAHDQITAKNWGPGSLASLIATEAGAYLGVGAVRVHASGPAVLLQPQAFSTVALVIHELMTNAAKYGALSGRHGQVDITWKIGESGDIELDWNEVVGPTIQVPTRRGFGTTIIERSIPHELGGKAMLDYRPTGLRACFVLPSRHAVIGESAELDAAATVAAITSQPARLSGLVLLVEDNMIIALDAEDMLLSLGAARVAVAATVREALCWLDRETPDFALLDVNLGPEMSWAVAARLQALGVPHMFATGYGSGVDYPAKHRNTVLVMKPYSSDSIARALGGVFQEMPLDRAVAGATVSA